MSLDDNNVLDREAVIKPSAKFPVSFKAAAIATVLLIIFNVVLDPLPSVAYSLTTNILTELLGYPFLSLMLAFLVAFIPYRKLSYAEKFVPSMILINFILNAIVAILKVILLVVTGRMPGLN